MSVKPRALVVVRHAGQPVRSVEFEHMAYHEATARGQGGIPVRGTANANMGNSGPGIEACLCPPGEMLIRGVVDVIRKEAKIQRCNATCQFLFKARRPLSGQCSHGGEVKRMPVDAPQPVPGG